MIRLQQSPGRVVDCVTVADLEKNNVEIPTWIERPRRTKEKPTEDVLLCNDNEHLLFYVEAGSTSFYTAHSRVKSLASPDHILITIESPDTALDKVVRVALATRQILSGLKLPSCVKTDGISALHVYIPLDSKGDFETARSAGEFICRLVRLNLHDLVTFKGTEGYNFGKVTVDYLINEKGKFVIAPYSFAQGESATVATPILWEEITEALQFEQLNHATIFSRLKQNGDLFAGLLKKKANVEELLARLQENYAFLF